MLSELVEEIEEKLRSIIREEIRLALSESKGSLLETDFKIGQKKEKEEINKNLPVLLTAKEVAKILGVNVQRVYEIVRTRKVNGFPVVKIGERQYRFNREAILKWINRDNQ